MKNEPDLNKFWKLLKSPVSIISHRNVDVDGMACCLAFAEELKRRGYECEIVIPESVSKSAKQLADNLGYEVKTNEKPKGKSSLILDALSPKQIEPITLEDLPKPVAVIDHHFENKEWRVDFYWIESRPSCAEILLKFFDPTPKSADVLLAGIITDTSMFRWADPGTLQAVLKLLEKGATVESAAKIIQVKSDISEKIAKLKAARKIKIDRWGDLLVASTEVGSFESSVAGALMVLGADIAAVASERKDLTRVSVRSLDLGIHLGKIMQDLADEVKGSGGGHDRAAVLEVKGQSKHLLNTVLSRIQGELHGVRSSNTKTRRIE